MRRPTSDRRPGRCPGVPSADSVTNSAQTGSQPINSCSQNQRRIIGGILAPVLARQGKPSARRGGGDALGLDLQNPSVQVFPSSYERSCWNRKLVGVMS